MASIGEETGKLEPSHIGGGIGSGVAALESSDLQVSAQDSGISWEL